MDIIASKLLGQLTARSFLFCVVDQAVSVKYLARHQHITDYVIQARAY